MHTQREGSSQPHRSYSNEVLKGSVDYYFYIFCSGKFISSIQPHASIFCSITSLSVKSTIEANWCQVWNYPALTLKLLFYSWVFYSWVFYSWVFYSWVVILLMSCYFIHELLFYSSIVFFYSSIIILLMSSNYSLVVILMMSFFTHELLFYSWLVILIMSCYYSNNSWSSCYFTHEL